MDNPNPELESSLNQQEGNDNKGREPVDRISNLQDTVIHRILSLIDTKEAVRTVVLSSKWRHRWVGVNNLFLSCVGSTYEAFSGFMKYILEKCTATTLERVYLICPRTTDFSTLFSWVYFVQSRNVGKFLIHVGKADSFVPRPLPPFILTCTTLVFLGLRSCFDIRIPRHIRCFPNLKGMSLCVVFPDHQDVLIRLINCCPALEKLQLVGFLDQVDGLSFHIPGGTLRKLFLWIMANEGAENYHCGFEIHVTNLEYFESVNKSMACYWFVDPHSFRNVSLMFTSGRRGTVFLLFTWIYNTKLLTLHPGTLELLGPYLYEMHSLLPSIGFFRFLTCLILHLNATYGWGCLNFLHLSHPLKTLVLDVTEMNIGEYEFPQSIITWDPPSEKIPVCLEQSLKRIGMKGLQGRIDELQAIDYLLDNAKVLESMTIGFPDTDSKGEISTVIMEFPRASVDCQIYIYKDIFYETKLPVGRDDITIREFVPKV